jgi:hypothetical protein
MCISVFLMVSVVVWLLCRFEGAPQLPLVVGLFLFMFCVSHGHLLAVVLNAFPQAWQSLNVGKTCKVAQLCSCCPKLCCAYALAPPGQGQHVNPGLSNICPLLTHVVTLSTCTAGVRPTRAAMGGGISLAAAWPGTAPQSVTTTPHGPDGAHTRQAMTTQQHPTSTTHRWVDRGGGYAQRDCFGHKLIG